MARRTDPPNRAGILGRIKDHAAARAERSRQRRLRDRETTAWTLITRSRMLVRESKRLLLCIAERRARDPREENTVARLRDDVAAAEANCRADADLARRALDSDEMRDTYSHLIATARSAAKSLTNKAPQLHSSTRYDTAVNVQALDDLIAQWTDASSVSGESESEPGSS